MDLLIALENVDRLKRECEETHFKAVTSNLTDIEINKSFKAVYDGLNSIKTGLHKIAGWNKNGSDKYSTPDAIKGLTYPIAGIESNIQTMKHEFDKMDSHLTRRGYRLVDKRNGNKVSQLTKTYQKSFKKVADALSELSTVELKVQVSNEEE